MKVKHLIVFVYLILVSCNKERDYVSDPGPNFKVAFIITDSSGNNLLPHDLPENPVVNPADYSAIGLNGKQIGEYSRDQELGHIFRMIHNSREITESTEYLEDSVFVFYPCFNENCDTVQIYKNDFYNQDTVWQCTAQQIIWNNDTLGKYYCELLPISY